AQEPLQDGVDLAALPRHHAVAEQPRSPGPERARHPVWPVPLLLDGPLHAPASLLAHAVGGVKDVPDGLAGDAGGPADAGHGRLAIAPDDLLIQSAHCTPLVS